MIADGKFGWILNGKLCLLVSYGVQVFVDVPDLLLGKVRTCRLISTYYLYSTYGRVNRFILEEEPAEQ